MADSTLTAIRNKVRLLTRTPSLNQMTNATLDNYINTFVQYDFPSEVRLGSTRSTVAFYTIPYVDKYATNTVDATDPLYNFKNKYIDVFDPVYVDGIQVYYTQSRENFFRFYPKNKYTETISTGDGATTAYTGTFTNIPVAQESITFTSVGTASQGIVMVDVPVVDANGNPTVNGNLYASNAVPAASPTTVDATNTIDYSTGIYAVTFPSAPGSSEDIKATYLPYAGARPDTVLYWSDTFFVRPIPTKVYEVNVEVDIRPAELLATSQSPQLEQWWQYIAYGASKKILEDRMDIDTVAKIMPEFEKQERLVLRRTLEQQSNERTATIYSQQTSLYGGPGFNNSNFF